MILQPFFGKFIVVLTPANIISIICEHTFARLIIMRFLHWYFIYFLYNMEPLSSRFSSLCYGGL